MRDHWRGGQPLSATSSLVEHRTAAAQLRLNKRNKDLTRHTWSTKSTANTFNAYMALSENRLTHGNPTWQALLSTVNLPHKLGPSLILRPTYQPAALLFRCLLLSPKQCFTSKPRQLWVLRIRIETYLDPQTTNTSWEDTTFCAYRCI